MMVVCVAAEASEVAGVVKVDGPVGAGMSGGV